VLFVAEGFKISFTSEPALIIIGSTYFFGAVKMPKQKNGVPIKIKTEYDRFVSPLASRSASAAMQEIFSAQRKFSTWRRLWLTLAETQKELGLDISNKAIAEMRAHLDDIDFVRAEEYERQLRHDVMAHIHAFGDAAPTARRIIHLGATSCEITDNSELILIRDAGKLICKYLANIVDKLGHFAKTYRSQPTLGFTHYQPAQLTTVGKRATLWCYDFYRDLKNMERLLDALPFRSIKGTTGTQASFLALFNGNQTKVKKLEQLFAKKMGFKNIVPVTGQTYTRKIDSEILFALSNMAASVHKFANDVRLLAGMKELEEPFESKQVGSSAMAYKRNPMRSERATGLARFLISLTQSTLQTHAEQWLERTLDDSSNRRITLSEGFLAADGMLNIVLNVVDGLVVYPNVIKTHLMAELPFMATEEILMAGVKAGGDRQNLHEKIRQHSQAASAEVKIHGRPNDLITRLKADDDFKNINIDSLLDPKKFVGRAPEQVDDFIKECVVPIRRRYRSDLKITGQVKV
jgi:adenylosuccinate lyase